MLMEISCAVYIYRGEHSLYIHISIYVYTVIKKNGSDPLQNKVRWQVIAQNLTGDLAPTPPGPV
jgi:hypothetical protein